MKVDEQIRPHWTSLQLIQRDKNLVKTNADSIET